jgi:phenylalanyl-tRNA synthetase alpha chain
MLDQLHDLETLALAELAAAKDAAAVEAWRLAYLGNSGKLKAAMGGLKDVPKELKPAVGARLNTVKSTLEQALEARKAAVGGAAGPASGPQVDLTEPGLVDSAALGRRHIIMRVREELVEVFARMGFEVAQGPELEDDEHNFVKLNIPAGHPARDPIDNFYVDDPAKVQSPRMLRSQTSTVQVRVMEEAVKRGGGRLASSIRIISPGRVYRPDTVDATHSFMFHQIEGLAVDRGLTMAELKTTLLQFARLLRAGRGDPTAPELLPVHRAVRRARHEDRPQARRAATLGRAGRLRHGRSGGLRALRNRPRRMDRLRVRLRDRAHRHGEVRHPGHPPAVPERPAVP